MKKLFIILAILLITSFANAQTWYDVNQVTFAWDAVTTLSDGTPIPAGNTVKYQVYTKPNSVSTGTKTGNEITATQLLISFTAEGSYFLGVESLRYSGTTLINKSASIAWSDVASNCQGGVAFGVNYWKSLMQPANLRRIP